MLVQQRSQSHHSSLVIRDLTLRSAGSFGMFHLMRLLCDGRGSWLGPAADLVFRIYVLFD